MRWKSRHLKFNFGVLPAESVWNLSPQLARQFSRQHHLWKGPTAWIQQTQSSLHRLILHMIDVCIYNIYTFAASNVFADVRLQICTLYNYIPSTSWVMRDDERKAKPGNMHKYAQQQAIQCKPQGAAVWCFSKPGGHLTRERFLMLSGFSSCLFLVESEDEAYASAPLDQEPRLQIQLHNAKQLKGLQKPSKCRPSDCVHDIFLLKILPYGGSSEFRKSKGRRQAHQLARIS